MRCLGRAIVVSLWIGTVIVAAWLMLGFVGHFWYVFFAILLFVLALAVFNPRGLGDRGAAWRLLHGIPGYGPSRLRLGAMTTVYLGLAILIGSYGVFAAEHTTASTAAVSSIAATQATFTTPSPVVPTQTAASTATPLPPTSTPDVAATAAAAATVAASSTASANATQGANAVIAVQHLGAGNTLLQAGNLPGAINEFATAQVLSPQRPDVHSAVATAQALAVSATAVAHAAVVAATATAQAHLVAATAQAQATATAGTRALAVSPPPGSYVASSNGIGVGVGDFRYVKAFSFYEAAPGARYIACAVEVAGADAMNVNPLYFTLELADGASYPIDSSMYEYWSDPLQATEVPAGGNASGGLLFLVKDGVGPKALIYRPLQLFSDTVVVVDLTRPTK